MPAKDIEPVPDLVADSGGSGINAEYIEGAGKRGAGGVVEVRVNRGS